MDTGRMIDTCMALYGAGGGTKHSQDNRLHFRIPEDKNGRQVWNRGAVGQTPPRLSLGTYLD
jgi:hypothetical protein